MRSAISAIALLSALALASCASNPPEGASQKAVNEDPRAKLLEYRSAKEICSSTSPQCKQWIDMALRCEINLAEGIAGNACSKAESYRERVTGIALSTGPGAYSF
jgi:hypothetical protein